MNKPYYIELQYKFLIGWGKAKYIVCYNLSVEYKESILVPNLAFYSSYFGLKNLPVKHFVSTGNILETLRTQVHQKHYWLKEGTNVLMFLLFNKFVLLQDTRANDSMTVFFYSASNVQLILV